MVNSALIRVLSDRVKDIEDRIVVIEDHIERLAILVNQLIAYERKYGSSK